MEWDEISILSSSHKVRSRGRMLDWPPSARSNDRVRPWLMPWSRAPNQIMVGGPSSHNAIKRRWGQGSWYGVHWCCHKPHLQSLIRFRGCTVSNGEALAPSQLPGRRRHWTTSPISVYRRLDCVLFTTMANSSTKPDGQPFLPLSL
jgi:hypothetical protein